MILSQVSQKIIKAADGLGVVKAWKQNPTQKPKHVAINILQGLFSALGFSSAVKAWRKYRSQKARHVLAGIFNGVADRITGKVVVTAIKLFMVTAFAGMVGGGIYMTMGLAAAASGTGVAIYTYGRDFFQESFEKKKLASVFSKPRLQKSAVAFATSAVGGAAGAWFIKTEFVQGILSPVKNIFSHGADSLKQTFNIRAQLPQIPAAVQKSLNPLNPVIGAPSNAGT